MLQAPSKSKEALECLNAMVTDALQHLPYSLQYMEKVRNKQVHLSCLAPGGMHTAQGEGKYKCFVAALAVYVL